MSTYDYTVQQAIDRGLKVISQPAKIILYLTPVAFILLLVLHFSVLNLLAIPVGILLSTIYSAWATARWRLWAYSHVSNIDQLQRSAELAGLLMIQSYDKDSLFMSRRQRQTLKSLQNRFQDEPVFIDDPSVPDETHIFCGTFFSAARQPIITLKKNGIQLNPDGVFTWDQISDERIIQKTFSRMSANTGENIRAGTKDFLRFECAGQLFEIPLSSLLGITKWKLDLLLYIYRGRFMLTQQKR